VIFSRCCLYQIAHPPKVPLNSRCHRWSAAQGSMPLYQVVINENTQLAPSETTRSSKSADGRVATGATRQKKESCLTKTKHPLDSDRPSHGRRLRFFALSAAIALNTRLRPDSSRPIRQDGLSLGYLSSSPIQSIR
jgi:hypothetical protein